MTKSNDDSMLEDLFALERRAPPAVPDALMARVLHDAEVTDPAIKPARWRDWIAGLGGVPGLSGLAMATCVGFWLGVAPPQNLPDLAGQLLGAQSAALDLSDEVEFDGFGWDIGEG